MVAHGQFSIRIPNFAEGQSVPMDSWQLEQFQGPMQGHRVLQGLE